MQAPHPPGGADPESATLHLARADIGFCAAHFSVVGDRVERLHGHNYHVWLRAQGRLRQDGLVHDFAALKRELREECAALDERVLVATLDSTLQVSCTEHEVTVLGHGRRYVLPRDDVCLLPVGNTTCECLARHLLRALRARLGTLPLRLELGVEELPGQGASLAE